MFSPFGFNLKCFELTFSHSFVSFREKMFSIRNMFEVCGIRVDGYMGSFSPSGGFASVDVAVCTIEKANALINKLIDEKKIHKLGGCYVMNSAFMCITFILNKILKRFFVMMDYTKGVQPVDCDLPVDL